MANPSNNGLFAGQSSARPAEVVAVQGVQQRVDSLFPETADVVQLGG